MLRTSSLEQIYDPQTAGNPGGCTPFGGNIIPAGRLNPAAVNYFNAFPLPTRTDRVLNNYLTHNRSNSKYNRFNARTDWNLSPSNQFFARFSYDNSTSNLASNGYCITFTGQTASQGAPYTCQGYNSGTAASNPLPAPGFPNFDPDNPPQGLGETVVDRNNKHSRLQQYNLQLQQQFGARDVFSMAYVGTRGDRLSTYYNNVTQYNAYTIGETTRLFPNLGYLPYNVYNGSSNYNGLQLHYEHRANNFLATASYAWSHALDNTDSPFDGTPVTILLYYYQAANYGNSSRMSGISPARHLSIICRLGEGSASPKRQPGGRSCSRRLANL